ncbi:MAG: hypothetical protein M0011_04355 [Elusimicrobia bacterium]|nr:hypothetical protein [Elusimicrobiota bacterium]
MKRSEDELALYAMLGYLAASLLATVLLLLAALAAMKAVFAAARFLLGPREVYWLKPALYDSVGFAAAAAGTALLQYLSISLLRTLLRDQAFLSALVAFCALFCGLLFWRGALFSPLGAYGFSGLAVTLSALIGGLAAVFQKASDNPWQGYSYRK